MLSTVPVLFSYWARAGARHDWARYLNDHLAGVGRRAPRRFVGLGTVPLQAPGARRARAGRGAWRSWAWPGMQIGTHAGDWNLDHPALFPVFETAERAGRGRLRPPLGHAGAPERMTRYWLPWLVGMPAETALAICSVIFGGVLERLPRLRIGFAHGGGAFPGTSAESRTDSRSGRTWLRWTTRILRRDYLRRFYVDSLTHDADALRLLLRAARPGTVAMGSDYPFPLGESPPGRLIASMSDLDPATRERLLSAPRSNCSNVTSWISSEHRRRSSGVPPGRQALERWALEQDRRDSLAWSGREFALPVDDDGAPLVYLCGNSLGLMPRDVRAVVAGASSTTGRGVASRATRRNEPWYSYHEPLVPPGAAGGRAAR